MIEIPEIWSQCEITKMSKRTRELVEAAGFDVESLSENSVKVICKQGSESCDKRST